MGLSCDCDFEYDGEGWYWRDRYLTIMPPVERRKRCGCCGVLINWGEEVFSYPRFRAPRSDIEESIWGCDEVPIPNWYTCEECSDLISAVEDLGFCWQWGESIKGQIADYFDTRTPEAL